MSKGSPVVFQIVTVMAMVYLLVVHSEGQVTFSRGWTPGKRGSEQHAAIKTATHLCRILINQIQQLSECTSQRVEENESTAGAITMFA